MAKDDHGGQASAGCIRALGGSAWAAAASQGPTKTQSGIALVLIAALVALLLNDAKAAASVLHGLFFLCFSLAVLWRCAAVCMARRPRRASKLRLERLPTYTIIVPLYHEADMAPGLVAALARLNYPKDRLQILFVLEADDIETQSALRRIRTTAPLEVVIAPPGAPTTKPRACNIGLEHATGEYVVVYDAEDRPHPLQLQEAASRFAENAGSLGCLQAPLRISGASNLLSRQFALEYAAQFEIMLPALIRLGAPFPLGGTSNHFRTSLLRAVGGWDPWNVTEDADLGFRLAAHGFGAKMLRLPTWESAPHAIGEWLPQRTRWVKGYMQTWGVHTRRPLLGGLKCATALQATLGLSILSALAHGPVVLLVAAEVAVALVQRSIPPIALSDVALLTTGWCGAILAMFAGAQRAGLRMRLIDAAAAPFYWALQSAAFALAVMQLCTRPYHWNKTQHRPPDGILIGVALDVDREASVRRAA